MVDAAEDIEGSIAVRDLPAIERPEHDVKSGRHWWIKPADAIRWALGTGRYPKFPFPDEAAMRSVEIPQPVKKGPSYREAVLNELRRLKLDPKALPHVRQGTPCPSTAGHERTCAARDVDRQL